MVHTQTPVNHYAIWYVYMLRDSTFVAKVKEQSAYRVLTEEHAKFDKEITTDRKKQGDG